MTPPLGRHARRLHRAHRRRPTLRPAPLVVFATWAEVEAIMLSTFEQYDDALRRLS